MKEMETSETMSQFLASFRSRPLLNYLWDMRLRGDTMMAIGNHLIVALTLCIGTFLRLWQINALGYNSDEAVYAGQAAAIAGTPVLKEMFPIFRAHPLLFPFMVSLGFRLQFSDLLGRLFSVAFGVSTIYLVYQIGCLLYNRRAGVLAALIMALMPYHVVVTRQVLLDGPMVFFTTLTLYTMARFAGNQQPGWLYVAGAGMGLTFLAKETGIILLGAIYVFLALAPSITVRIRDLIISVICLVAMIVPHFLTVTLAGRSKTAQQYLTWQLFRRPNHEWDFYPTTVPFAIGLLVVLAAVLGLWLLRRERTWRETLLLAWIGVPVLFFQLWPVKGFQYLLPTAPAFALLAARAIVCWKADCNLHIRGLILHGDAIRLLIMLGVVASLAVPSWSAVQYVATSQFLAGSGGIPGGRETGTWVRQNIPQGAKLLAIGPSMANIIQFYGYRRTYGLSVSSNPLHRNPVYQPVENPDKVIRNGEIQYLVYDVYSASRSPKFAESLLKFVKRFNGRVVHTEVVTTTAQDGTKVTKPIIVIYEVRP